MFFPGASEEKLDTYTTETLPGKLVPFDNILKKNNEGKGWVAGDSFTFADIALFQLTETLIDNVCFFFFFLLFILFLIFLISIFLTSSLRNGSLPRATPSSSPTRSVLPNMIKLLPTLPARREVEFKSSSLTSLRRSKDKLN